MIRIPKCSCGATGTHVDGPDTYACLACNAWLEAKCGDTSCRYCAKRTEKPSQVTK